MLAKTRAKLEELETQVSELEARISSAKRRKTAEKPAEPDSDEYVAHAVTTYCTKKGQKTRP